MLQLKYLKEQKIYPVSFKTISKNVVQITGDFPVKTTGFTISKEGKNWKGDYSDYTTVYQKLDDGVQFSNDGSTYVPPVPPEPYVPTLDEVKEQKVAEMNSIQQTIIDKGTDVQLSDGSVEHFTLSDPDQRSIMGLQLRLMAGEKELPWHVSDETIPCTFYSEEDMKKIGEVCTNFVTWHVTYFRDLRIYIRSLSSKEAVEQITYGIIIPEEFRSDPLKKMMEEQNS